MPKVTDPITDQEIAFAHLILSGNMTDRDAAESSGLNPSTAAYTKAKTRVQAYMLEHRAAMHKERVQQETDELRRLELCRQQVLARLWEIANLSREVTRNSVTAQIKALSLIISIEGLIPDRRAAEKRPAVPPREYGKPLADRARAESSRHLARLRLYPRRIRASPSAKRCVGISSSHFPFCSGHERPFLPEKRLL
jgi:hypothetical protein